MALATLLDVVDGGDPAAPALIVGSGGGALSRAQLRALALRAAAALRAAGVRPGDVVTIAEPNTVEFVVAFLGVALARGVAAPLNQNYTPDEFKYYMEDAGATLLLVGPAGNAAAEAAELVPCLSFAVRVPPAGSAEEPALQVTSRSEGAAAPEVPPPDGGAAAALAEPPAPEDVGLFLHTSGTTSRPKVRWVIFF
jgi:acyl-CoA synthetase (AMP-forming)/AMP-acid ligase II